MRRIGANDPLKSAASVKIRGFISSFPNLIKSRSLFFNQSSSADGWLQCDTVNEILFVSSS
jgi:hypothetical protein